MERRFINTEVWQALRKLNPSLKQLYFYAWSKADAVGVYSPDWDYLKIDLSAKYSEEDFLKLPEVKKIGKNKFIFLDFISVNYTALKPDYNPHKPAYRALQQNNLTLNSSLNQACFKLEEEDVKEDEGEDVKGGMQGGAKKFVKPELSEICQYFLDQNFSGIVQEEANKFYNYYTANGWKVGKNPMKDWKAAIRNWITNYSNFNSNTNGNSKTGQSEREQRNNELDQLREHVSAAKSAIINSPEYLSPTGS